MNGLVITYRDAAAGCRRTLVKLDPATDEVTFYQGVLTGGDTRPVGLLGARLRDAAGGLGVRRDWMLDASGFEAVRVEEIDPQTRVVGIGDRL